MCNSEDYQDLLQARMDELEDMDDALNSTVYKDENDTDDSENCTSTQTNTDPDVVKVNTDMFDKDLWIHAYEFNRPIRTFKYDGEIISAKVLKKFTPEKYIFATYPSNTVKIIYTSKLNQ